MSIPSSWIMTNLEDVVVIRDDLRKPVNATERSSRIGPYPYYGATGQVGWIDAYLMDGEYILLGEDGAPFLDPSKDKAYRVVGKSWVNNHAHVLHGADGVVDNRYLLYALNNTDYRQFANGTTRLKLTQGAMRKIPMPIAPIAEQRRIVARIEELFSDLDAGVAALKRAKANLRRYRAAVLKAAVEGKLTEEWRARHPAKEPASKLLARILQERRQKWEAEQLARFAAAKKEPPKNWREKYVEPAPPDALALINLPDGWCWASVEQVAEFTRYGSSAKTNEEDSGVPVLRMGNIVDCSLDYSDLKFLPHDHPEFPDLLLKKGDLLFNRTNSAELVGKSAVYEGQHDPCSFASYLISVRCLAGCDSGFLCYHINSAHGRRWVKSVVSQQVGQANVNGSKLQSLAFPLPSVAEQLQIVTEVAERLSQIEAAASAIDHDLFRATRLRQSILKQAFEGKLVPQDPADEPASVLLERLQANRSGNDRNGTATTQSRPRGRRRKSKTTGREV